MRWIGNGKLFLLLFALISPLYALSQQAKITGTISDSLGKPLYGVTVAVFGKPAGTTTNDVGFYSLTVPANEPLKIVFTYTGMKSDTTVVRLEAGEEKTINHTLRRTIYQIKEFTIHDRSLKRVNLEPINPKIVTVIPTPNQSVEDLIKTMPGVSSANELSSSYSVRGGNYDENLVYINDFEVYRPLLVRSGQQEGLSVINPDMVSDIYFSAGGFDAIYGDKLSSVLDITYRKPHKFGGSVSAGLLGGSLELENRSPNKKWYWMTGFRYKSTSYLLNTFDTRGDYKPSFGDFQVLTGYEFSKRFSVELFGNYARNNYSLIPESRETNFGTISDAKRFTVYFEGQEADRYRIFSGAASFTYRPSEKTKLKLINSRFDTREEENFDILGQYFLDQLENDLGKDNFGDVAFNLGVGSFLDHARNRLEGMVYSTEHKGEYIGEKILLQWGARFQHEDISDRLHEWYYNDSSGFSVPTPRDSVNPQITLNDVVIARNTQVSNRYSGYLQNTWLISDTAHFSITTGVRAQFWDLNRQLVVSPRISVRYAPPSRKNLVLRASGGFYYQPPYYRELRGLDGTLYPDTKAQKSIHIVLGSDYTFLALGREFKLTSEVYYKFLENLIPYKVDNLRIRYLPQYTSHGYARGIDFRLFGEFVPGAESWASLSILQTQEDLKGDAYYVYYNAEGEEIISGYTFDQRAVDSTRIEPGYIPRPTDQRVTFGLFFQDFLPSFPTYKMQLSLLFGTGLPFGPPGKNRYTDVLRTPNYRRVDIGFSKQLIGEDVKKPHSRFFGKFESLWVGIEVFNLLQVSNVASYNWITDITNARQYAVPNYLTSRQLNIRLNAKF